MLTCVILAIILLGFGEPVSQALKYCDTAYR